MIVTYFLLPMAIAWTGLVVAGIGLTVSSSSAVLAGGCVYVIGAVFGLVNAIRFGKNFNGEYYRHCSAMLSTYNVKGYGTSIGSVVLLAVGITAVSMLISLPYQSFEYNPVQWGGAPTPALAQAWGLMDSEEEPTGTFDLTPNPYYTEIDAYDYNDLIAVLSDYGTAKAFWEKYSDTEDYICIYNVRLQTHDEISVYDPTELLRFGLSDGTTEGKIFYTDYDYMVIGSMWAFASATDYSYHQVELEECTVYADWNRSQFTAAAQNSPSVSNVTYADFTGEFLGDDKDEDALWIWWSDFTLQISCFGYRSEYFTAEVDAFGELNGNTIYCQGYDPYTDSVYNVSLTYVPAKDSLNGADTIYMQADGLFNMEYIRADDEDAIPDDLGYFEGEYHMAHNYTMQMNLWFESDYSGVSWKQWGGSVPVEMRFSLSDMGDFIGSGMAYWYPPGSTRPEFEAYFDNSNLEFTMYYDGYNFIVNCPELELYDASFFAD